MEVGCCKGQSESGVPQFDTQQYHSATHHVIQNPHFMSYNICSYKVDGLCKRLLLIYICLTFFFSFLTFVSFSFPDYFKFVY